MTGFSPAADNLPMVRAGLSDQHSSRAGGFNGWFGNPEGGSQLDYAGSKYYK